MSYSGRRRCVLYFILSIETTEYTRINARRKILKLSLKLPHTFTQPEILKENINAFRYLIQRLKYYKFLPIKMLSILILFENFIIILENFKDNLSYIIWISIILWFQNHRYHAKCKKNFKCWKRSWNHALKGFHALRTFEVRNKKIFDMRMYTFLRYWKLHIPIVDKNGC